MRILYLGFNSFLTFKRGVENVIEFQSHSFSFDKKYYMHLGDSTSVYRYRDMVCFSVKKNFFWILTLNFLILKLAKRKNLRIHSHSPLLTFFSLKRTNILTVHDGLSYQARCVGSRFLFFYSVIERSAYLKSNFVHFISNYTKSKSLFPTANKNFEIIYNTSVFEKQIVDRTSTDRTKNAHILKVLSVRSIEERARFDLLIEVSELFNKEICFRIVGKGPLLEHYRQIVLTKKLSNIKFEGYVTDAVLNEYYEESDCVLVIADYGEGFGLPIIEGYLHDKLVLASNVCAIPEVIIDSKFLFNNNVNELYDKLKRLQMYPKLDFRGYYYEKFSNNNINKKFKKLYENII